MDLHLTHAELFDAKMFEGFKGMQGVDALGVALLDPTRISIHPSVYRSDIAYTEEFFDVVLEAIPRFVEQDLQMIARHIGRRLQFDSSILTSFYGGVDPANKDLSFGYVGSNIGLRPGSHIERIIREARLLPKMTPERLRSFLLENGISVPTWYQHTPGENGREVFLCLRNFAIAFNNLGVNRL